jgi:RimJ/RimL family protein N-acetyltransferase
MPGCVRLETDRLLLREFAESDAESYYLLGSNPAVIRYTGADLLKSTEHALEVLRTRPIQDYQLHGFGRLACVLRSSGAVIGFAGLKRLEDLGEVDLGYWLLPEYWGRGLATEASRAILDDGFGRLALARIIGLVHPENRASIRVLKKLGMSRVEVIDYHGDATLKYVIEALDFVNRTQPNDRPGPLLPSVNLASAQ